MTGSTQPSWEEIQYGGSPIVDMHAHPSLKVSLFRRVFTRAKAASRAFNPLLFRTNFTKLEQGGVDVLVSSIYAPERQIVEDCKYLKLLRLLMPVTYRNLFSNGYFGVTIGMLNKLEGQIWDSPKAAVAKSYEALEAILNQGESRQIAVVQSVEGGHSLDGRLENLGALHQRGVAMLTLAHFYPNEAVHCVYPYPAFAQKLGCFKDRHDLTLGLTDFGVQVVEKMVELGMILDISHCTPVARRQIYEIVGTRMPLVASHVGAYEINPSPYNLQDWEIKRIAEGGGLVCVIFMNYWLMPHAGGMGLNYIARTIEHLVKVGGIEHVGIGTDFDGFTDTPEDVKDASQLPVVTRRLLGDGYAREDIEKIWGKNALRVLREGWRM